MKKCHLCIYIFISIITKIKCTIKCVGNYVVKFIMSCKSYVEIYIVSNVKIINVLTKMYLQYSNDENPVSWHSLKLGWLRYCMALSIFGYRFVLLTGFDVANPRSWSSLVFAAWFSVEKLFLGSSALM